MPLIKFNKKKTHGHRIKPKGGAIDLASIWQETQPKQQHLKEQIPRNYSQSKSTLLDNLPKTPIQDSGSNINKIR